VTGCGFPANEDLTVSIAGRTVGTGRSDGGGGFTATIQLNGDFAGQAGADLTVIVQGRVSLTQATAEFTVTSR
jgi:hypothetical protein